jgi:N-6 DNA Methylase
MEVKHGRAGDSVKRKESARRKRLGQYFTGHKLARLLVALSDVDGCRSAIDPMCGSGDMLSAVREYAPSVSLSGIEIDRTAFAACVARFAAPANAGLHLLRGNAFSWPVISKLPHTHFDLVITNPPYVRYQSLAEDSDTDSESLPNAEMVRRGLLEIASKLKTLEAKEREIFISLVEKYSGLSDLAVPSWILCAMLTAVGGRLAMIVSESWLNRDYAHPIHYILMKFFRLRWVVEDSHRAWFDDVQVKTTLLIADRIGLVQDVKQACSGRKYVHVALPASSVDERSVVGRLFPAESNPDISFARQLHELEDENGRSSHPGFSFARKSMSSKLEGLLATSSNAKWLTSCEPDMITRKRVEGRHEEVSLPQELLALGPNPTASFTTLESIGGQVGQGLRTGANSFFYFDLISDEGHSCLVAPGKSLNIERVIVPADALRPVLRRQSELTSGFMLNASRLQGRVLILEDHKRLLQRNGGRKSVAERRDPTGATTATTLDLTEYVAAAAKVNIGTEEHPRFVPQLSAVRTNETKKSVDDTKTARHWYTLPPLARRHRPDLFIPRVNHLHPRVVINSQPPTIIDANFSTVWLEPEATIDAYALLACLNSSWIVSAMELIATVMGGGALKLESTHLRRLPIPELSKQEWSELSLLGKQLVGENRLGALSEIDRLILSNIFGVKRANVALKEIEQLKSLRLKNRRRQGNAKG